MKLCDSAGCFWPTGLAGQVTGVAGAYFQEQVVGSVVGVGLIGHATHTVGSVIVFHILTIATLIGPLPQFHLISSSLNCATAMPVYDGGVVLLVSLPNATGFDLVIVSNADTIGE